MLKEYDYYNEHDHVSQLHFFILMQVISPLARFLSKAEDLKYTVSTYGQREAGQYSPGQVIVDETNSCNTTLELRRMLRIDSSTW